MKHCSDVVLLAHLDGELSSWRSRLVKRHLEKCWQCRTRQFDIEARVRELMRVVDAPDFLGEDKVVAARQRFLAWRETHEADPATPSWTVRAAGSGRRFRLAGAFAAAALCGFAWLQFSPPSTVLAAPLLERSRALEEAPAGLPAQVVHRTLHLEERAEGRIRRRRIEVWQGPSKAAPGMPSRRMKTRRVYDEGDRLLSCEWSGQSGLRTVFRRGVAPESRPAASLATALAPESIDSAGEMELSAREFSNLLGDVSKAVVEETAQAYVVRYQAPAPPRSGPVRLAKASLVLSRPDLRPVEHSLVVERDGATREYRLLETRLDRYPSQIVNSVVFEPDRELLGPAAPAPGPTALSVAEAAPAAPEPPPVPVNASLEMSVITLLGEANISLGDQAVLKRMPDGGVVLSLTLENEQQQERVLTALESVLDDPSLRIELDPPTAAPSAALPAERLVERARRAKAHAIALRQIGGRFSVAQLAAMDEDTRAQWRTMVRRHAQAFEYETMKLREELRALFPAMPVTRDEGTAVAPVDLASLPAAADRLARLGAQHEETIRTAFMGRKAMEAHHLAQSLKAAEELAIAIRATVAEE